MNTLLSALVRFLSTLVQPDPLLATPWWCGEGWAEEPQQKSAVVRGSAVVYGGRCVRLIPPPSTTLQNMKTI